MVDSLFQVVRHAPERMLHEVRRYAAHAAVARPQRPSSVLVVCHGDICRSPFAAVIMGRWLAADGIAVESAGFVGPGRRSPPDAVHAAHRRGVNLTTHRSRILTGPLVSAADLVVTLEVAQAREIRRRFAKASAQVLVLGDFDPDHTAPRTIEDPFGQPADVFDRVYARIERCSGTLAAALARHRKRAG